MYLYKINMSHIQFKYIIISIISITMIKHFFLYKIILILKNIFTINKCMILH